MKVNNEKIVFEAFKDGKVVKSFTVKNRLLDLYLDWIMYRQLPASVRDTVYPYATYNFDMNNIEPFPYAYLQYQTTQTITDSSTSMIYDFPADVFEAIMTTDSNIKTLISRYIFTITTSPMTGLGFGADDNSNPYLYAFIDLSVAGIDGTDADFFSYTRYDEITSNEVSTDGSYLPFRASVSDETSELDKIHLHYDLNGTGAYESYIASDLTYTRLSAGVVELTGFRNFGITTDSLFPSDSLYSSDTLYPIQTGQIKSVAFEYKLTDQNGNIRYITTYVNKQDLDITYNDKEFKIKLKVERGSY